MVEGCSSRAACGFATLEDEEVSSNICAARVGEEVWDFRSESSGNGIEEGASGSCLGGTGREVEEGCAFRVGRDDAEI